MSVSLFPITQPSAPASAGSALPLYREVAWDFQRDIPLTRGGEPVWVEGKEAVLCWAWKALRVPRFRQEIYSWAYGSELDSLMGQPYTEDTKRAEARRYLQEALLINPYITGVAEIQVDFVENVLQLRARITTIYGDGEVKANV